ncbi:MAG TPA: cation:proton antiporter [Methylophilaceae bacterium]|nr:cation:proton antiporter [Methylophilaceae bacterium]
MIFAIWALIVGILLIIMALASSLLKRLPLSTAMLYLGAGILLGPIGAKLLLPSPFEHAVLLERLTEVGVLISLFAAGLKLGLPLNDKRWLLSVRLAFVSMTLTVALIAVIAMFGLGFSLGAAILLGGILAPTDPVLASDVQVANEADTDRLRFSLTGEGGLNDGSAFPFIMLGLGLLGLHDLGAWGWRWIVVAVLWATFAGLLIGGGLGYLIGKLVVYLRTNHQEAVGLDEFLSLGLIALAYGVAVLCHAYGFLAVFAAGLALCRVSERLDNGSIQKMVGAELEGGDAYEKVATDPKLASTYMMQVVKGFNDQLEDISEFALVLVLGALLAYTYFYADLLWLAPAVFLLVRPIAVWLGLLRAPTGRQQRLLISWFGIRGIGSMYYLFYAINHGLPRPLAEKMIALTLGVVVISILLHGISTTPLMNFYLKTKGRSRP